MGPDHPWGPTESDYERATAEQDRLWGTPEHSLAIMRRYSPSLDDDDARQWAAYLRQSASPGKGLGLEIRAGLHTGECEQHDGKIGGIAVHIGARVAAEAAAGEVLVSRTVKDLVAGSGLEFEERGARELKGVPGTWRLYAVTT